MNETSFVPLDEGVLPEGVRARFVEGVNGIRVHVLEAGFEEPGRPLVMLVHGFPDLAYGWRGVMPLLAEAGSHVVAADQRGYGRSGGTEATYETALGPYSTLNKVRDAVGLVSALGYSSVAAVVGHDSGSPIAGWCALIRPDVFRSVVLMSAPFGGVAALGGGERAAARVVPARASGMDAELARLEPARKHYQSYYSTREANENMWRSPQGVHAFLRAYYHFKSADWAGNQPHALEGMTAEALGELPTYYVMRLEEGMAETVAAEMPSEDAIAGCGWLPEDELAVFSGEYERTGFQGGLQSYRWGTSGLGGAELSLFAGRTIDVPSCFVSGASDWGNYQSPGALERMVESACTDFRGVHFIEGAGHWVQQEQAEVVSAAVLEFLGG
ncbi:MAG: alpha/beta hydrolase [Dehalococcoidia bacterium]|jgi:pimeloyl-ACP methyl ester carboxylesterase|nr:alpha/beta hydrolase [Dehalococcoidia bacterium]